VPLHAGDEFDEEVERRKEEDPYLMFLPPYCPELSLTETLWHKIEYEWLPSDAYNGFRKMTNALFEAIRDIGSKYHITSA
jgi:transposase